MPRKKQELQDLQQTDTTLSNEYFKDELIEKNDKYEIYERTFLKDFEAYNTLKGKIVYEANQTIKIKKPIKLSGGDNE